MSKYMVRVPYLESSDFNQDGSLKPNVCKGKPVVVMVQGVFCGYCTKAKPAFEKFAHTCQKVVAVTIQTDGGPSEKEAAKIVNKLSPSPGVPTFLGFNSQGKFVGVHKGGRELADFLNFANTLN